MDFFGKIKKIIKTETDEKEDSWRVVIEDSAKNRLSLIFELDPHDEFPLGFPVQVKVLVTQTTLVTA